MAPRQTDPQFKLRLTPELKEQLEASASLNHRSISAEMIARLQESFVSEARHEGVAYGMQHVASKVISLLLTRIVMDNRGKTSPEELNKWFGAEFDRLTFEHSDGTPMDLPPVKPEDKGQ